MTSSSYSTPTSALRVPFFPARSMIRSRSVSTSSTTSSSTAMTNQSRRARRTARRRQGSLSSSAVVVSLPIVDVNNNSSSSLAVPIAAPTMAAGSASVVLDRVAILKAFAAVNQASESNSSSNSSSSNNPANRTSRYEKPTSYREARRRQLRPVSLSDPAIEQELIRLRDSVPSIAGSNASDLTIINEAISLICDLESQLIRKFKCQTLPVLPLS